VIFFAPMPPPPQQHQFQPLAASLAPELAPRPEHSISKQAVQHSAQQDGSSAGHPESMPAPLPQQQLQQQQQQQQHHAAGSAPSAAAVAAAPAKKAPEPEPEVLEPLGLGRDAAGHDLSLERNKLACQSAGAARIRELELEKAAIIAGTHPEVQRQQRILEAQLAARLRAADAQLKQQIENYQGLLAYELGEIESQHEAALERAKEEITASMAARIKRLENCRDGVKDAVDTRMSTRNTRSKKDSKNYVDDPNEYFALLQLGAGAGGGGKGGKKRSSTPIGGVTKALEDEELIADLVALNDQWDEQQARAAHSSKRPRLA
jgi:Sds3-like